MSSDWLEYRLRYLWDSWSDDSIQTLTKLDLDDLRRVFENSRLYEQNMRDAAYVQEFVGFVKDINIVLIECSEYILSLDGKARKSIVKEELKKQVESLLKSKKEARITAAVSVVMLAATKKGEKENGNKETVSAGGRVVPQNGKTSGRCGEERD